MGPTKEKYLAFVQQLNQYSHDYFVNASSAISDQEYDQLYRKLEEIEREHPEYIVEESPTQRVGEAPSEAFQKVKHPVRMYSLSKIFDVNDLRRFLKRFSTLRQDYGADIDNYWVDYKMDGLSCDLIYNEGKLTRALTRGDGIVGEDVTQNIFMFTNIPLRIATKQTVFVRGEVIVHRADFLQVNRAREALHLPLFSNTRNYASGSLRQIDPNITKQRKLRFYAWELIVLGKSMYIDQQHKYLSQMGFSLPKGQLCTSAEEIMSFINETARIRNTLSYDIDGVVIKQNDPAFRKALGFNNHDPLWATAWKFAADGAETTIKSVTWQIGRTGKLTPVANIAPVAINGVTISRVTLNNLAYLQKTKLGAGAKVRVIRSGDVIPKLADIISSGTPTEIPQVCPSCGKPLTVKGSDLKCDNPDCQERLISSLTHILAPYTTDIKGIGPKFVRTAVTSGTLTKIQDLFLPTESKSPNIKQDLLDTLVTRMRSVNLRDLIMMLGIEGIGLAVSGKIAYAANSLTGLIELLEDDEKMRYLNISEAIKTNLKRWYSEPRHQTLLKDLQTYALDNVN